MTIRLLTFDLDDTLWELAPVLIRAEAILYEWLKQFVPAVTARFTLDELRALRLQIARDEPHIGHRITQLRLRSLQHAMQTAGVHADELDSLVTRAFAVLLEARHDVELFNDAEYTLQTLKNNYTLGVITNGNFDIARAGLDRYFDFAVVAEQLERAKPHAEPFQHALALAQCEPHECIHIGDDAENDVRGAQRLGIYTIWFNRLGLPWAGEEPPSQEIKQLAELPAAIGRIANATH